jgi:predicted ABC-type transport system involved in lysophospholipase L1 biosynthesis ATPase subunit
MTEIRKPIIVAQGLKKIFQGCDKPFELFQDISISIYPHDTVSYIGRSGKGKSTLLHILGGIEPISEGSIAVLGKQLQEWAPEFLRSRFFGFIFQSFHLLDDLDVLSNVLLPVRIARESTAKQSEFGDRARYLIARVGLESRLCSKAKWLSGGEKQRVAIARALVMDPHIIFADEPTGNLDSHTAALVVELLFEVVSSENKALFLVTHQSDIAERCEHRFMLHQGKLQALTLKK